MGEVAEMFDVKPSLIRHWESQFSVLKPQRNKKGNRLFTVRDVENLKMIYHLVKERGMTLDGARKALKRPHAAEDGVRRDAELLERLQRIRAMLSEVREELRPEEEGVLVAADPVSDPAPETLPAEHPSGGAAPRAKRKAVVRIAGPEEEPADPASGSRPKAAASRRVRRKKEEPESKELFAFYEQSLF